MRDVEGVPNLKVGCLNDLREADLEEIDFTVNLSDTCNREIAANNSYCHFFIRDSEKTQDIDYSNFKSIVDLVLQRMEDNPDETVLVNCAMGISRSVTIASTVGAMKTGNTLSQMIKEVRSPRLRPSPALRKYGQRYLNTRRSSKEFHEGEKVKVCLKGRVKNVFEADDYYGPDDKTSYCLKLVNQGELRPGDIDVWVDSDKLTDAEEEDTDGR